MKTKSIDQSCPFIFSLLFHTLFLICMSLFRWPLRCCCLDSCYCHPCPIMVIVHALMLIFSLISVFFFPRSADVLLFFVCQQLLARSRSYFFRPNTQFFYSRSYPSLPPHKSSFEVLFSSILMDSFIFLDHYYPILPPLQTSDLPPLFELHPTVPSSKLSLLDL